MSQNVAILPISRTLFRLLFKINGGIRVSGAENIPKSGGALLCPNHISDADPAAILVAVKRNDLNALAKSELFDVKVLGAYIRAIGALPVTRDSADRAALRTCEAVLNAGRLMLIFPEGRCSPSGKLQKIQPGAMMLSLKTGAPIVPIGIRGTNHVLPYGEIRPRFAGGGVTVTVDKPIYPVDFAHLPHRQALTGFTKAIGRRLAELTGQEPNGFS